MKWVHLTTAPGQMEMEAEMWRDMLLEERVPAMVHQGDLAGFFPVSSQPCRIMVAEDELERAREVLKGLLQEE